MTSSNNFLESPPSMARKIQRQQLTQAKKSKNDEFYTQLLDIERELTHYGAHFKDKVVYCNCDDPALSNFVKYFYENFETLGLKKLIATGFRTEDDPHGSYFEYTGQSDQRTRFQNKQISSLQGDGDFRGNRMSRVSSGSGHCGNQPPFLFV